MAYYGMRRSTRYGWLLKPLREASEELVRQFRELTDADLDWRPFTGERSLREVAMDLQGYEEMCLGYLERILYENQPRLVAVDLDTLVEERGQRIDVDSALYRYLDLRQEISYLLWGLSTEEWQRQGRHPFRGLISVADIARDLMEHDLSYLAQVRRIRALLSEHRRVVGEADQGVDAGPVDP